MMKIINTRQANENLINYMEEHPILNKTIIGAPANIRIEYEKLHFNLQLTVVEKV